MATRRSRNLFARGRRSVPGGVNSPVRALVCASRERILKSLEAEAARSGDES